MVNTANHDRTLVGSNALENRLRREAKRKGYVLRKSRTRNPLADDYGRFVLMADTRGARVPGAAAASNAAAMRTGHGDRPGT